MTTEAAVIEGLVSRWEVMLERARQMPSDSTDALVEAWLSDCTALMGLTQEQVPALASPLGMVFVSETAQPIVKVLADIFPEMMRLRVIERHAAQSLASLAFDEGEEPRKSDWQTSAAHPDMASLQKRWLN